MMVASSDKGAWKFHERLRALPDEHQRGILRFQRRLIEFQKSRLLSEPQCRIVEEYLLRLGERGRNPSNTGNIEDLFCYTLDDTRDPIRSFAQALADSVKIVPMDPDAPLYPRVRSLDGKRTFERVADFAHLD